MTDVRLIVYDTLLEAEKSEGPKGDIFKDTLTKYAYLDKQQRAFIHCMLNGVSERCITLDYVIDSVSSTPVSKMKKPVKILLRMGAYQILYMDGVPDRAACNETVALAKKKHLGNLSGFINGVLRSISRLEGNISYPKRDDDLAKYLSVYYSMPELIVDRISTDYGYEMCEQILKNCLEVSPVYARVNVSRVSADELIERLNGYQDVQVTKVPGMNAFKFEKMDSLSDIAEFTDGLFSIQDVSSQLVCSVAGIKNGDIVIDTCASPGGKSLNAADLLNGSGKVISCDVSQEKITRIDENILRCHFDNIETVVADATEYNKEFDSFADVVICDVPCSGLGVMGRKNDIRYSITEEGLESLCTLQRRILDNAVKYVKPGGTFMYSTCTILKGENTENCRYIIDKLGLSPVAIDESLIPFDECETLKDGYIQLLPGQYDTDGFFLAKFRRNM